MADMVQVLLVWVTVAMVIAMLPSALKHRNLALAVVVARPAPRSHVMVVRRSELAEVVDLTVARARLRPTAAATPV